MGELPWGILRGVWSIDSCNTDLDNRGRLLIVFCDPIVVHDGVGSNLHILERTMQISAFGPEMGRRFQMASAPTLKTKLQTEDPVAFVRLRSLDRHHVVTGCAPPESAFAVQVQMQALQSIRLSLGFKPLERSSVDAGSIFLFDMEQRPSIDLHGPFDIVRFYVSRSSLHQLAIRNDLRWDGQLKSSSLGISDFTLQSLAASLTPAFETDDAPAMLIDHVALAFCARLLSAYGGSQSGTDARGGLAPWQLRRVKEMIEHSLRGDLRLAELAEQCSLSPSYFARAFRTSTGTSPHRYILERKIDRAKDMLRRPDASLAEVSALCGFADQSHLNRVFAQLAGVSPGAWRRSCG